MSVGDVVADYVLAAGDPAEVLAAVLVSLAERGIVGGGIMEPIRAAAAWRWDSYNTEARRPMLGFQRADAGDIWPGNLHGYATWCARVNPLDPADARRQLLTGPYRGGWETPEEAAAAVDAWLLEHGWALVSGALPPRRRA